MAEFDPGSEPEDTQEAIVQATYRALCEHGYAGLTVQRIGDEFEKSKSLLYHHYEGKDELLLDFLSYMLEGFQSEAASDDIDDARETLREALDRALEPDPDEEYAEFLEAMTELRAQAAHDEHYREHFSRSDEVFRDAFAEIVRRGIEDGVFRDVDPDRAGAFLHSLAVGAITRDATTDGVRMEAIREEAKAYVEERLLTDANTDGQDGRY